MGLCLFSPTLYLRNRESEKLVFMSLLLFAANDGEEVVCNWPSEVENFTFLTSVPRIFVNGCQPPVHQQ